DCEIGGPHIYVDHWTLRAPTVDDQWRVARIASEEIDHCRKFLRMLGMVGLDRSDILFRPRSKREVDAFKVDMPEWGDFAAFGFLIDKVGQYQLDEMVGSSFLPTDDVLPTILREELGHVAYGEQQLEKMMATPEGKIAAQLAIDKWYVVGLDMFGRSESARDERYIEWGLKKRTNGKMREDYIAEMDPKISALGLRDRDVRPGDRVALVLRDSPWFIAAFLGAAKIGAIPVPLSTLARPDELDFMLRDSGATLTVTDADADLFDDRPGQVTAAPT